MRTEGGVKGRSQWVAGLGGGWANGKRGLRGGGGVKRRSQWVAGFRKGEGLSGGAWPMGHELKERGRA